MRALLALRALLACVLLMGCVAPDGDDVAVRSLDYDRYVTDIQPIFDVRCANPTCHGRPERPLSIYSALAWRAERDRTYLFEELSDEELQHNYDVSRVLASDARAPADTTLLRKPLGDAAATYHGGGEVFEGETDRDYQAMLDWLRQP